ncbi:MAG: alpha/beta fold hydrolase [Spirochaetes bacterium]|nr:alpha/beta fold hydrolase [Spirochaetota bacterium]
MNLAEYAKPISFKSNSDIGILLIHGFTSTTSSVFYVGEKLYKAGFNVEAPSLSGHGTTWQELNKVKYQDWINDVETAFENLKKRASRIFVVGFSMGGTLALYLAENYPEFLGIILINHALFLKKDWRLPFLPIMRFFLPYDKAVAGDIKDPAVKEMAYKKSPLQAAYQFMKLIKLVKSNLSRVTQPTLIFKSIEDHTLPIVNAHYTCDKISSQVKEIIWLKNSYHVAPLDYDKDIICEKSIEFIKSMGV